MPRPERKPGNDQFNKMIPSRPELVKPMRRKVQIPADWTGDRLGFVVIIKAGKIAPARIAAQLDQPCSNHDAKTKPAKKPDYEERWPAFREWPTIEQWTKENREKAGLEQLCFPSVAIPNLPDVNDGHIHRPENGEDDRVGVTAENTERYSETKPGKG